MDRKKRKPVKHKFVVAWGKYVDSKSYYIQDQLDLAEKENAPETAYSRRSDGTWRTIEQIEDPGLRATLEEYIKYLK
jgi:hypothetical protein